MYDQGSIYNILLLEPRVTRIKGQKEKSPYVTYYILHVSVQSASLANGTAA
jgi:hypothetical protein